VINPKYEGRTYDCDQHAPEIEACYAGRSKGGKEVATDDGTDNPKHNVEQEPLARATHDLAPEKASDQT
jgi:hypothetical protein